MIVPQSELSLLKRGKRWFFLPDHPGWKEGQVVRLRSGSESPFVITVTSIVVGDSGAKVSFTPGDCREEQVYLAAGWPDYTNDPARAMPNELPPFPESMQDRKSRTAWLALALRYTAELPRHQSRRSSRSSQTRSARVVYEAGSPEAVRVVRLWAEKASGNIG